MTKVTAGRVGKPHGLEGGQVRGLLRQGLACGQVSRIGGVFGIGAGGAAMLFTPEMSGVLDGTRTAPGGR